MQRKEAMLYEKLDAGKVHCYLCAHQCRISPGKLGFCAVRENDGGVLFTHTYGKLVAESVDPIEKKPLFHMLPGSTSYSVATIGCNFRCAFCQNWQISQVREALESGVRSFDAPPASIVRSAVDAGCASISYTYTEPTIFFEYAYDTARLAHEAGLANIFVTNGYMTREALDTIRPYLDAANVDLKAFTDEGYRKMCSARLEPVLETIRRMHDYGIWLEVTTLVIPDENDSDAELRGMADFIASVGKDIPWHLSLFHPDYKFTDHRVTPVETLRRAHPFGKEAGLEYVYIGNVPEEENTVCHNCGDLLIRRYGFRVLENRIEDGRCPRCSAAIPGRGLDRKARV